MNQLQILLTELKNQIPNREKLNTKVSAAPVGWHIEHTLLAMNKMIKAMVQSNPAEYKPQFSLPRMLVLTLGKIPRGRAKAPDITLPRQSATAEDEELEARVAESAAVILLLDGLSANHFFKHPVFGNLNLKRGIKTVAIHTRHHLKIIEDIVKAG